MNKYRIPIVVNTYTEVEAESLYEAVISVNTGNPDIDGVPNPEDVNSWEIDQWEAVYKNGETLADKDWEHIYLGEYTEEFTKTL